MKPIPLTRGMTAWVDDEDFAKLNQFKWHAHKGHKTWYAARNVGHGRGNRSIVTMHCEILNVGKPQKGHPVSKYR